MTLLVVVAGLLGKMCICACSSVHARLSTIARDLTTVVGLRLFVAVPRDGREPDLSVRALLILLGIATEDAIATPISSSSSTSSFTTKVGGHAIEVVLH
mmetsp:Transcript_80051/g.158587  ORF Transcript_80051/g.158587 Transcript_80051/m.158587 type:complete len:99 (-) Transcript_80051:854-1150(-)